MQMNVDRGRIEAVIFDLYNTLVYAGLQIHPYQKLFRSVGFSPKEMAMARQWIMTANTPIEEILSVYCPDIEADFDQFEADLELEVDSVRVYPETFGVLEMLKHQSYVLGLISNLAAPFKRPVYNLGLDRYFDKMVFSSDVGLLKPGPNIYRKIIGDLGICPEQMLMTGDQLAKDVEAPRSLGMKAVLLDRLGKAPDSIGSLEGIFDYL